MSDVLTQPGTMAASSQPRPVNVGSVPDIMSQLQAIQAQRQATTAPILQGMRDTGAAMNRLTQADLARPEAQTPPQPQQPHADMFGALANPLVGFLMLASGFTHTPAIAAANALAGAVNGRYQRDETAYTNAMTAWRENVDLALKRDAEHRAKVQEALDMMKTNVATGEAMLKVADTEANDQQGMILSGANLWTEREQLSMARERLAVELQNANRNQQMEQERLDMARQSAAQSAAVNAPIVAAAQEYMLALKSGDPNRVEQAQRDYLEAKNPTAAAGLGKWQVMTDPTRTDANGNPTQYRYNPQTGAATNLEGTEAYRPGGAERVGTQPNTATPAMAKERDADILAQARFQEQFGHAPAAASSKDQSEMAKIRTDLRAGIGVKVLSEDTATMAAQFYLKTGQMPAGFGGQAMRVQILETARNIAQSEGYTVDDFLARRATLKADTGSLAAVTKQKNAAQGYERGAGKSLDLMTQLIPPTPEPLNMQALTRWVRTGETEFGDIQVPAWQASLITALDQYAKVLSGATGAQGSTDSARALALSLIPPGSTSAQINAIVPVLRRDMSYRISGYDTQISDIQSEIEHPGRASALGGMRALPPAKSQLVPGQVYDTSRGPARWDGTQFELVR